MTDSGIGHWERDRDDWIGILRSRGIRPSRAMGQNFLIEPEVADAIVAGAGIDGGDTVLEIGPGMGMLTRALAATGAQVVAVELDRDLKAYLEGDLAEFANVTLHEGDGLQFDFGATVPGDYHLVANLPYSTGTHIVRRFLEADRPPVSMTVMLQREVAERLVAEPPNMSLLTITRVIRAEAELLFLVPPGAFWPEPKIDSSVVRLTIRDVPLTNDEESAAIFRLATMAFQRKRKTIGNGLSQGLGVPKSDVEAVLQEAGIDPSRRPQTLGVPEWLAIAERLPG
ncbi:MAG TPA: 16S rRNA (adenine(1518)-N(6)/adenine(1519)-N(6))-dimethyltransferase RsmA [Thermomicrobiales bacterium]|nr:16S rRNA (adenine(1518)-N(6)/adenine(1519)-N(6))-dimethyltransferase RsmA [Thermomicrobiales bacterium]